MPFVKLDCAILTSTIWFDKDARDVFLTALLMAEPREYENGAAQIAVREITMTGWSAPPGWYGYVPAAGSGIINRCGISREIGLAALERLGDPDTESRSKAFEGRRLIRIDGGYLVLNYQAYRERDYTAADRSKRYREKLAASHRSVTASHRDITQAEAEAEVEKSQKKKGPSISPSKMDPDFEAAANFWNETIAPKWGKARVLPKTLAGLGEKFGHLKKAMTATYPEWTLLAELEMIFRTLPGLKAESWFTFRDGIFSHNYHQKNERLWTGFYRSMYGEKGNGNGRSDGRPDAADQPTFADFGGRTIEDVRRERELRSVPKDPTAGPKNSVS